MVMGAVRALCEFSLLVNQQNHSNLSLTALDDALKQFYQKNGIFQEQNMSKSPKAKVDYLLATESHQLREPKIQKIAAAMEALVYAAEKVSSTKCRQFQVHLNRTRQAATTWSDADRLKAIEQLECEIHQVTPSKCRLFDKLFQHHEWQLLQEVGTEATSPRSIFLKQLALMKSAAEEESYMAANMATNKQLQFQNHLSNAQKEATTLSLADSERVTMQLEKVIYGITSNGQKLFNKGFCIRLIQFEAWLGTISIQSLRKTIEQGVIHFRYPMMHPVSHISGSNRQMGSRDNFTSDISEWLNIANVKEAYRSGNKVNYIQQMLKHNDRCTGLDILEETLSYLALQGWYDIDSAIVLNLPSTANKQQSTRRAHLLGLQTIQDEPIIHPVSQQVYHLRETHVRGVCRSIKSISLRDESKNFEIPNFGRLFRSQIEEDCRH